MAEQIAMSMPTKIIDKAVPSWGKSRAYQEICPNESFFEAVWSMRYIVLLRYVMVWYGLCGVLHSGKLWYVMSCNLV